ncbi:MAG: hypothetical protein Alis3KO_38860 [Aliiglaciecola sp.]
MDDDQGFCNLVKNTLAKAQMDCVSVESVELAKTTFMRGQFDLLLIDYKLPDGCGIGLVETFSHRAPCILITAWGDENVAVKALQSGAKDYVAKDSTGQFLKVLPEVIRKAIKLSSIEQDLEYARTRLRSVFDQAPDLMIITDDRFSIIDFNKYAAKHYGSVNLQVGQSLLLLLARESLDTIANNLNAEFDVVVPFANRDIPFTVYATPIVDNELLFVFKNKLDALEVKKAEKIIENITQENSNLMSLNKRLANQTNIDSSGIIGLSKGISVLKQTITNVADTDANVLIMGETGTGKELVAKEIHAQSNRHDKPLIKLNCAAIPENLVESELFGHVKGAFTGAIKDHKGRFEQANTGTLFLDEIGELALSVQVKLLRVLQEGQLEPVGCDHSIKVDTRIIAATNRNLSKMVDEGNFRADLFYRLNVIPLTVPPLRERTSDIVLLVQHFLSQYANLYDRNKPVLSEQTLNYLREHSWPGNIRELQNFVERLVVLGKVDVHSVLSESESRENSETNAAKSEEEAPHTSLAEMEHDFILKTLERCKWRISGEYGAAKKLGLNPSTLRFRMKKLGILKSKKGSNVDD